MDRKKASKINVLLVPKGFCRVEVSCELLGFKKSTPIARLTREHLDAVRYQLQRPLPLLEASSRESRQQRRS